MSYERALRSWLRGSVPSVGSYSVVHGASSGDPLSSATVLHEGPLWSGSTRVRERDLWWVRLEDGTVTACVQASDGSSTRLVPLSIRQQESLWSSRLSSARLDPLWLNERLLPSGQVVPEIPLAFVARREERAERGSARREPRVARSMVARVNAALWHANVGALPTASELSETAPLWPESLRRASEPASGARASLARRLRADPRRAALLDARAASVARMSEAQLAADAHACTLLAL